tara:strand:- start:340 stop:522 length:183 start_codon:yes stop_codon:yes gene_type:complete
MYVNHLLIKLENIHSQLSEVIDSNNIDKQDLSFAREQLEEVREVFLLEDINTFYGQRKEE